MTAKLALVGETERDRLFVVQDLEPALPNALRELLLQQQAVGVCHEG